MPQATETSTMSRDRVSSVAAFSPRHTRPRTPNLRDAALLEGPGALRFAHAAMIGALLTEHPEPIVGSFADPIDVRDRAEHIDKVLAAVGDYINILIRDTVDYVPAGAVERTNLAGLLKDTRGDVVGSIMNAAEQCGRER